MIIFELTVLWVLLLILLNCTTTGIHLLAHKANETVDETLDWLNNITFAFVGLPTIILWAVLFLRPMIFVLFGK